jgi:ribosomal protein S18 acetylase RimI-like enzyme
VRARWSQAIEQPPSPAHRVLVACDGPRVVGMAASVPTACDNAPDATAIEVTALEVDPDHRRSGHGSRLLAACVDLGRQDGAVEVQCWVPDSAEARAWFLGASGMAADGATRQLVGPDGNNLGESRWTATL